jgi:hypothetical protein
MKELVQQQRAELYATGNRNLNMAVSEATIQQIDRLKKEYRLRSRDAIVARIIRKASVTVSLDHYVQRAASSPIRFIAGSRRLSPSSWSITSRKSRSVFAT